MPIIELTEVSKLYGFGDATAVALDEVSLTVESGEFVAVMGPSGSGKSTLMNIIGLLDRPTHGNYKLNGRKVERLRPSRQAKARRDTIGFVFQSFNLLPKLNVLDNVALPLTYKGMGRVKRQKRASEILDRVGLADREYFMPRQLSGGQTQRVAIARALINNPNIIIADEPTGNLDEKTESEILQVLMKLKETGLALVCVTHAKSVMLHSDRVLALQEGKLTEVNLKPEAAPKTRTKKAGTIKKRKTSEK